MRLEEPGPIQLIFVHKSSKPQSAKQHKEPPNAKKCSIVHSYTTLYYVLKEKRMAEITVPAL